MSDTAPRPQALRSSLLGCRHGFSTRRGGVSGGVFESLNLGRLECGDRPENVAENWRIFGKAVGIDTTRFVHGRQVHGSEVRIVTASDARGILEKTSEPGCDGYVTNEAGVPLAVFTADCAPLLMHEPEAGVIAAVHCGWRGTASDIMANAVERMQALGARPERIRAAIGPCIRQCCFQTGPEVPETMERLLGSELGELCVPDKTEGKYRLDLPGVIRRRLMQLGLTAEHIDDLGVCTMCAPGGRYWSHRAMGLARGSQASIIVL